MKMKINDNVLDGHKPTPLPYSFLRKIETGKAVIKDAINKWREVGFLDAATTNYEEEEMAIALDNISYDFLTKNKRIVKLAETYDNNNNAGKDTKKFLFECEVFALIISVISLLDKRGESFDYEMFLRGLEKYSFLSVKMDKYEFNCDVEAEYVAILSKLVASYIKEHK